MRYANILRSALVLHTVTLVVFGGATAAQLPGDERSGAGWGGSSISLLALLV